MNIKSLKISNYKCFKSKSGFDDIKKINLIIGKNNSGKSSLLDLLEILTNKDTSKVKYLKNSDPCLHLQVEITESMVDRVFPNNVQGGAIDANHNSYGRSLIGKKIEFSIDINQNSFEFEVEDSKKDTALISQANYSKSIFNDTLSTYKSKIVKRMSAERDIKPEQYDKNTTISENGKGVTNTIQAFINFNHLPSRLVTENFLDDLNKIFNPDYNFKKITTQLDTNSGIWEIYLEEENKGEIPLSKSGSGIKTIIIVLTYIILIPQIEDNDHSRYIFCFEEIENNLHPSLLRRLSSYIYEKCIEKNFTVFLTTHSNILIDQFNKTIDAQIVHITQSNGFSSTKKCTTYLEHNGILDDLDIRASDLLQANGIIWVEGPSDRIYINKWIDLWSEGKLKEGNHYQCLFYGGRLLAHLTLEKNEIFSKYVSILNTNRNSIILIDSDRRSKGDDINSTKKRIIDEFHNHGSLCWITAGREIENYIPKGVVSEITSNKIVSQVKPFEDFFNYLDRQKKSAGNYYRKSKPILAELVAERLSKDLQKNILDIDEKLINICNKIESWNKQ